MRENAMREVIVQQYAVSLDGFSCADDSEFQRHVFGVDDPELDTKFIENIGRAGTHIVGRVTYEGMAHHFPGATGPVADLMNSIPKVVFSRTLDRAEWPETRIAKGDLADEIGRLKAEPGGEILAHGGYRFLQALVQNDLVDEFRLYVFPVALGRGQSIFSTVEGLTRYQLASCTTYASGVVLQVLRREGDVR